MGIEVKSSLEVSYSDIQNLLVFLEEYPGAVGGLVIYAGQEIKQIAEKIWAVPWDRVV